jgi:hypothetical protein
MHQKSQELGDDIEPLGLGIGLETLIFKVQGALLGDTPQDEGHGTRGFRQGTFAIPEIPFGLNSHV